MKRTFTLSLGFVTALGLTACKGGGADAVKLVPDAATMIASVNLGTLMSSKLYTDNKAALEAQSKEMMDAAKGCNLDPEKMKSVVVGVDLASPDNMVMVISGEGIGKEENLTCMAGKIKEKAGKDPWVMEEQDGKKVLKIDDGDATGYIISEGSVVVASKSWAGAVKELIDGKGKAAVDNSLKDVYARAYTDKPIWASGQLPANAAGMLKGSPADGIKDFNVGLDTASGLGVWIAAGVASAEEATKKQEELQKAFDQYKGMAGGAGIPQDVIDSVKFGAKDVAVTAEAKLSDAAIDTMKSKLGPMMMGGMMGGGGAPPPPAAAPPPAGDPAAGGAPPPAGEAEPAKAPQ